MNLQVQIRFTRYRLMTDQLHSTFITVRSTLDCYRLASILCSGQYLIELYIFLAVDCIWFEKFLVFRNARILCPSLSTPTDVIPIYLQRQPLLSTTVLVQLLMTSLCPNLHNTETSIDIPKWKKPFFFILKKEA